MSLMPLIVGIVGFMLSGISAFLFFDATFVLSPVYYFVAAIFFYVVQIVFGLVGNVQTYIRRLSYMSTTVFICVGIASWIYNVWAFENFLSSSFFSKVVLFMILLLGVSFNFILYRTDYSYRKKRTNQRIPTTDKPTRHQQIREVRKKLASDDVYVVLGIDVDNDRD